MNIVKKIIPIIDILDVNCVVDKNYLKRYNDWIFNLVSVFLYILLILEKIVKYCKEFKINSVDGPHATSIKLISPIDCKVNTRWKDY